MSIQNINNSANKIIPESTCAVNTLEINQIELGKDSLLFDTNLSKNTSDYYALDRPLRNFEIKKDLLEYNYDPAKYRLRFKENTDYVKDVFEIYQSLPTINKMQQSKPQIPIFEQILVEKNDSAEIKKFIRKVNYDMLGYSCNHNSIDEKADKVYNNAVNIYNTVEYRAYRTFVDLTLVSLIKHIISVDEDGKIFNINQYESDDFDESFGINFPAAADVKRIAEYIITLNGMIAENNSQTNKHCSKCEAAVRRYNYSVFEINRMREELKEQQSIDQQYIDKPIENKYEMRAFLQNNYPSIDRFLLKDVQTKYKTTFNINLTFEELKKKIVETGLFTISNVHRTMFVNRK